MPVINSSKFFNSLQETFTHNRAFFIGYSLYWAYMYVLFWGGLFSSDSGMSSVWFSSVIPSTLLLLVAALIPKAQSLLARAGATTRIAAACLSLGVVGIAIAQMLDLSHLAGSALTGIGLGLMTLFYSWLLSSCRVSESLTITGAATIAGALLALLVSSLEAPLAILMLMLIPFVSSWCCSKAVHQTHDREIKSSPKSFQNKKTSNKLFLTLIAIAVVIGFLLGMNRGILNVVIGSQLGMYVFSLTAISVGLLFLAFSYVSRNERYAMFYVGIIIVAGVFILLSSFVKNDIVAFAVQTAGTTYFVSYFRIFCAEQAKRSKRRFQILAGGQAIFQVGQILGMVALDSSVFRFLETNSLASDIALIASFSILTLTAILLAKLTIHNQDKHSHYQKGDFAQACTIVAREADLTKRECEILTYYIQGFDRPSIARRLNISPETVKTHISNIYTKLEVHSKQELIDIFQKQNALLETDS